MISTRRGFLSHLIFLAAVSPWRPGRSSSLSPSAHDTLPPAATVPANPRKPPFPHQPPFQDVRPCASPLPPELLDWLHRPRQPVHADDLEWAAEFARNELHHEWATSNRSGLAHAYQARLREIDIARRLLPRIDCGGPLDFTYHGGSSPGCSRSVLPTLLFTVADQCPTDASWPEMKPIYLLAHCLTRHSTRTFRLDRLHF